MVSMWLRAGWAARGCWWLLEGIGQAWGGGSEPPALQSRGLPTVVLPSPLLVPRGLGPQPGRAGAAGC